MNQTAAARWEVVRSGGSAVKTHTDRPLSCSRTAAERPTTPPPTTTVSKNDPFTSLKVSKGPTLCRLPGSRYASRTSWLGLLTSLDIYCPGAVCCP